MHRHFARIALIMALASAGCSNGPGRSLDDRAFVDSSIPVDAAPPEPPAAPAAPVIQLGPQDTLADASADAGPPELDPNAPAMTASPVLIDEYVGEFNGQPIFANAFLAVLGDLSVRIPNEYRERYNRNPTPQQWRQAARELIKSELERIIVDELISAESYRTLDVPEQNLRRFLEAVRNNEISLRGGSAAATNRSIQDEEGLTVDELMKQRGDRVVLEQYIYRFRTGISVSPRDIERYYNQHFDEYNPDPTIRFRWIWVLAEDVEAVTRIGDELAETAPKQVPEAFARLAADPANRFSRDTEGLRETTFQGELSEQEFLRLDAGLNEALVSLAPGTFAGPIEHGSYVSWVFIESIRQVSVSLYDAQASIEKILIDQEFNRRLDLELARLQERAGISQEQIGDITGRLLAIAIERYQ